MYESGRELREPKSRMRGWEKGCMDQHEYISTVAMCQKGLPGYHILYKICRSINTPCYFYQVFLNSVFKNHNKQ